MHSFIAKGIWYCSAVERREAFSKMNQLVVKATNQSGGYGMLIGRESTEEMIENYTMQWQSKTKKGTRFKSF